MNVIISILRFGSVAWIKWLRRTLRLEVTLLLWMISLFWTVKNPTNHQVNKVSSTLHVNLLEMSSRVMRQKLFTLLKTYRRKHWGGKLINFEILVPPQLCLPGAVLLKMVCVFGCRGLKMSWTGSAGLVPLTPPTPGLQETTLPAEVTFILECL